MKWGEVRCNACREKGFYSRPLLRYLIGSITDGGELVIQCRDCREFVKLNYSNQHGDGATTFVLRDQQQSSGVAHARQRAV